MHVQKGVISTPPLHPSLHPIQYHDGLMPIAMLHDLEEFVSHAQTFINWC